MITFAPQSLRLSCTHFNRAGHASCHNHKESTMNLFKGLLFLHGHLTTQSMRLANTSYDDLHV